MFYYKLLCMITLRIKPQNLHFPVSREHCNSGAKKQRRAGSTSWLYHFLMLLLGAARCLVLAVLKEIKPVLDNTLAGVYQRSELSSALML